MDAFLTPGNLPAYFYGVADYFWNSIFWGFMIGIMIVLFWRIAFREH